MNNSSVFSFTPSEDATVKTEATSVTALDDFITSDSLGVNSIIDGVNDVTRYAGFKLPSVPLNDIAGFKLPSVPLNDIAGLASSIVPSPVADLVNSIPVSSGGFISKGTLENVINSVTPVGSIEDVGDLITGSALAQSSFGLAAFNMVDAGLSYIPDSLKPDFSNLGNISLADVVLNGGGIKNIYKNNLGTLARVAPEGVVKDLIGHNGGDSFVSFINGGGGNALSGKAGDGSLVDMAVDVLDSSQILSFSPRSLVDDVSKGIRGVDSVKEKAVKTISSLRNLKDPRA